MEELTEQQQSDQLEEEAKAYINKQSELFDLCKQELLSKYDGQYVLFEDGKVLDSGKDRVEVSMRAYRKGGMRPLFIELVSLDLKTIPSVYTPFFDESTDSTAS